MSSDWREYLSGGTAAMTNIFVTFPINKLMFRQVVHGFSLSEALQQLKSEGSSTLYRGVLMPLMQKSLSSSLMFGTYYQYKRMLTERSRFNDTRSHIGAALLSGCTEATLAPLERVQVLMQDTKFHSRFKNTVHAFLELRSYGIREYYRGLTAVLIRNGPSNLIFFTVKERVKTALPLKWSEESQYARYLCDFFCGACLGAFISTMFYPVNVTKTHMQIQIGGKFRSFSHVFKKLLRERGFLGMFKGVHVNYTRSFISWGIINLTYECVHNWLVLKYPS